MDQELDQIVTTNLSVDTIILSVDTIILSCSLSVDTGNTITINDAGGTVAWL
tara:strand:- start:641 stop:796 length:156 start_codon:yes stop_codon:yes gene_type:complete